MTRIVATLALGLALAAPGIALAAREFIDDAGHLDTTVRQVEKLAQVLGTPAEGRELATYASGLLDELRTKIAAIAAKDRPEVYYARGPQGLTTGLAGSINVEMIEFLGAKNVAGDERGGLTNVGLEQVVLWDPATIITNDPNFYREVWKLPVWNSVDAVRKKRVYLSPHLPFGWPSAAQVAEILGEPGVAPP